MSEDAEHVGGDAHSQVPCPDCEHGTLQVSDEIYADCDTCDAAVERNGVGI